MRINSSRKSLLEYLITACVILLVVWISFFPQPVHDKYYTATKLFLLFGFIALLIRKRTSVFKLKDFPLWIFLIAIGVNVLFAQEKEVALKTYWNLFIPMFVIYYLVSEEVHTPSKFNLLAKTVCISSILVALIGIFEVLSRMNPIHEYFFTKQVHYHAYTIAAIVRPMSTQYSPSPLGTYLVGCLPFNLFLFKQERSYFRFLGAMGIILNTVVLILTCSRGAYIGMIAAFIFYLFAQKKYRVIVVFFVVLSVFVIVMFRLPFPFNKFTPKGIIGKGDGILSNYRMDRCIMTKRIVRDHPFVGIGFQHFRSRFCEYYPRRCKNIHHEKRIADNMYLTILAETGIIGFVGFLIFLFSLLKSGWRHLAEFNMVSQKRWQLLVSLMAFIGLLFVMCGYEFWYWANPYLYFCLLIGCISAFGRDDK